MLHMILGIDLLKWLEYFFYLFSTFFVPASWTSRLYEFTHINTFSLAIAVLREALAFTLLLFEIAICFYNIKCNLLLGASHLFSVEFGAAWRVVLGTIWNSSWFFGLYFKHCINL
jgi:hypothetical protein